MKILLDNSILSGAELAESVVKEELVSWGDIQQKVNIHGYRKKVHKDTNKQKEIDAICTVGRLIREGKATVYSYNELDFEAFRRSVTVKEYNPLADCELKRCKSPIERSKFRQTINFFEHMAKGGKNDKKYKPENVSTFNQIPFITWLIELQEESINNFIEKKGILGLSDFEIESLNNIEWFKFICSRFDTPENYPDAFHLWAAERNNIDVFLTLEKKLPNTVKSINNSRNTKFGIKTKVCKPIEFLNSIGIIELDEPPIVEGEFYTFMEAHNEA